MVILYAAGTISVYIGPIIVHCNMSGCIATFGLRNPTMRNTDVGTKAEQRALPCTAIQATRPVSGAPDAKRCHIASEKFFEGR